MLGLQTFVFIIEMLYSVGGFQAPTEADGGQNGHHRKGRESSESGRQRQRDSNMNIDENINGEDNQNMPTDDDEPPVDIETMTKALQEVSLENRMKEQLAAAASVEKTTEEKVPVDPADMEHYTPPGTPQELSPANDQQIADMVSDLEKVEVKNQEPKQENPKHKRKPEQQHYQPPRAARTNSQRTDSWRSNASGHSQVQDEQPKAEVLPIDAEVETAVKEEYVESGSNTPTPLATPVSVEHKPEAPTVPMIGGIPFVPVETEKKAVKKEYCAYCNMLEKPIQTITSHSLFSAAGVPICPTFQKDYQIEVFIIEEINDIQVNFWTKFINFFKTSQNGIVFADVA